MSYMTEILTKLTARSTPETVPIMNKTQPSFAVLMSEYVDIKPHKSDVEDYNNWKALLTYINKNKKFIKEVYNDAGIKGVLAILYDAEGGNLVPGFLGEAHFNTLYY